jgi:hypothetical protein
VTAGHDDGQLELRFGPLYVVEVDDRFTTPLSGRDGREYAAPPQPLEHARRLAALLLDVPEAPEGTGPWQRALAGSAGCASCGHPRAASSEPPARRDERPRAGKGG